MRRALAITLCALAIIGVATILLFDRRTPAAPSGPLPASFSLTSERIDLPVDDVAALPDGPHADTVRANCTACHSESMILAQPPLKPEQWKATVTKMREVYKAPVPDAAVPGIVAYLSGLSAAKPVTPPAS